MEVIGVDIDHELARSFRFVLLPLLDEINYVLPIEIIKLESQHFDQPSEAIEICSSFCSTRTGDLAVNSEDFKLITDSEVTHAKSSARPIIFYFCECALHVSSSFWEFEPGRGPAPWTGWGVIGTPLVSAYRC